MQTLLTVLEVVLAAMALVVLVPATVLAIQMLSAWSTRARASTQPDSTSVRPQLAVLMPAHNEAGGIRAAIAAVKAELAPCDRLMVVADNCSDATATVAAEAGAEVIERADTLRRGKGYALDFGVHRLEADPPEVVVIVDSDCRVHRGALEVLARACVAHQRPAQALYLMRSPPGAALKTRIAEFAWAVKNHGRALGNRRLGLPCQLMGSGMAFTWPQIRQAPLASGHIVEDLQLGLDLAAAGHAPLFCPEALVTSVFPVSEEGLAAQRTRWEHGYLDVMFKQGPGLLWQALKSGRIGALFMALDLCVPPIALLGMVLVALCGVNAAFFALSLRVAPLLLALLALGVTSLALVLAWLRFGRTIVSARELIGVPGYVFGKIPMYLRALRRRQVEWVRTRRDDGQH